VARELQRAGESPVVIGGVVEGDLQVLIR